MNTAPEYRITVWRTSMHPRWYAYQVYRDRDRQLLAGGECRSKLSAEREAQARIRHIQQGASS